MTVARMLDMWQRMRAELRAAEEEWHPPLRDRFGREWTWASGDLWHHDGTLAYPRDMIDGLGLPPERLRGNPNYWRLCAACRSGWADSSPVQPRVLLGQAGWYDVRDGLYYYEAASAG